METIKTYLFNIFSNIPSSKEMDNLKSEILANMEDRYYELKNNGKSENESIGIVISEFGNIDELISEFEINTDEKKESYKSLDKEKIIKYLKDKKKSTFLISIGVVLCMIAGAILITFSQLINDKVLFTGYTEAFIAGIILIPTIVVIIPAIILFIYSSFIVDKYKYIKTDGFNLSFEAKAYIKNKLNSLKPKFIIYKTIGVCMCVVSPIIIFIGSAIGRSTSVYSVSVFIIFVSIAVFILINMNGYKSSLKMLIKKDEYLKSKDDKDKVIKGVNSIAWSIAICIFLLVSFIWKSWSVSWIIFPITCILLGGFKNSYKHLKNK